MATIGSIDHILKTTFRSVYEEYDKRQLASNAREQDILKKLEIERLEREKAEALEAARLKEEEENAKKNKGKKPPQNKVNTKLKSAKVNSTEVVNEPVVEDVQVLETQQEEEIVQDPSLDIKNYFVPIELMQLDDNLKSSLELRLQEIEANVENNKEMAKSLMNYLTSQRNIAKEDELLEEENLKRQGIIVGQHIPTLKSKLRIDKNFTGQFYKFSSNLLIAEELLEQNETDRLRRTGNLPITADAEKRDDERTQRRLLSESRKLRMSNQ